jgi:hypothetical protein
LFQIEGDDYDDDEGEEKEENNITQLAMSKSR